MSRQRYMFWLCIPWVAMSLMPYKVAEAQAVDNATTYALANQLADELELVRERMGRPYDESPRLPAHNCPGFFDSHFSL